VKITNKLIGIITILIVILFIGMAVQPSAIHSQNKRMSSTDLASQNVIHANMDRIYVSEATVMMQNITSHETGSTHFNAGVRSTIMYNYLLWFIEEMHVTNIHSNYQQFRMMTEKGMFRKFLHSDQSVMDLYKASIQAQQKVFKKQNYEYGMHLISSIRNGSLNSINSVYNNNGSTYILVHTMQNGLPGPISGQTGGQWEMVDINPTYFWVPIWVSTWWGGYPSLAWEEVAHTDYLNDVTIGHSAYNYYQYQRNNINGVKATLAKFFYGTAVATGILSFALRAILNAADVFIVGIVLATEAYVLSQWLSSVENSFHTLYDSTYVKVLNGMHGSNAGAPYMWTEFTAVDAWGYGITAIGDGVSINGYNYSGSEINLIPYIPLPVVAQVYAVQINSVAQSIASNAGNGNWAYGGSYN
jgi:hypothetical protein